MTGDDEAVTPPEPVEVELKLDVLDTAAADRLLEGDRLAGLHALGPVAVVEITDRYLDSPDAALRRAGWVGRLRSTEPSPDATLAMKSVARPSLGAVHRRQELEGPARLDAPAADWPPSAARERLLGLLGDALPHVTIVLAQRRRKRRFGGDGLEVEASLDRVDTIVGGRAVDTSVVLEVELVAGPEAGLAVVAGELAALSFLAPATISKVDRAMAAARRAGEDAAGAGPEAGGT